MYKRISHRTREEIQKRMLQATALAHQVDLDIDDPGAIEEWDADEDLRSENSIDSGSFKFTADLRHGDSLMAFSKKCSMGSIVTQAMENAAQQLSLNPLEAACVIIILDEAKDQLETIKHLLPEAVKVERMGYESTRTRFGGLAPNKGIFPEESIAPVETFKMKVQRVRHYLAQILDKTTEEILTKNTYYTLAKIIEDDYKTKRDEKELLRDEKKNTEAVRNLLLERARMEQLVKDKVADARVTVKNKEGEQHDTAITASTKRRAVLHWEEARTVQAGYILDNVHNLLEDKLEECRASIGEEYRVNAEIENYYDAARGDLSDAMDAWRERYEEDLEERDQEMLRLRIDKEAQLVRYQDLQETFMQREKEITEYLVDREDQRGRARHAARLNMMATRIQAWWRGVMVRRGLGPYRPKKAIKGKKDKTKGKGRVMKMMEEKQKGKKT